MRMTPPIVALTALILFCGAAAAGSTSELPRYEPGPPVSGVIRIWGTQHMAPVVKRWQEEFRRRHPDVWFETTLKGTASAQFALHVNVADLVLSGRQIFPYEYYGIYRRSQMNPIEIPVATGSFEVRSKSTALAVLVHRDNPLSKLTLKQLDGIYGAQRTGGWQRTEWITDVARGADENIRTWGQLGLGGEWADQPIRVYGPPGLYPGGVSFFQTRVMGGADTWNENLQEFADRGAMLQALSNDRYGIAYASLAYRTPDVKALALAEHEGGPYVALTRQSVADRTYPLSRFVYAYLAPDSPVGDPAPIQPRVLEFLRYILSREGQRAVEREGDYLPLTSDVVRQHRKALQ